MKSPKLRGVLFDAFGTLCRIEQPQSPYRPLLKCWRGILEKGFEAILTRNEPLAKLATEAGLGPEQIARMEKALETEKQSISLFPETTETLRILRTHGVKLAIVSNLAEPYGPPLRRIMPFNLDAYIFSYEVGAKKPDSAIYHQAIHALKVNQEELIMVGDSYQNDYLAPREMGIRAFLLKRESSSTFINQDSILPSLGELLLHLKIS